MKTRLRGSIHVIICALLVFATIFVFFARLFPSIPYDKDDWVYLSQFPETQIPTPPFDVWNPTRILPEHLMPAAGYFSAFVVYPITGDYMLSVSITTALLLSIFITVLYVSLYRLFQTLNEDKSGCAIAGLFTIALCFALFISKPSENLHLFIVYSLNLHFFYTLPNILNSILICELMRLYIKSNLSFKSVPTKTPLLVVLLYFSIFSMLFSSMVLFAFVVSVILLKFLDSMLCREHRKTKFLFRLKHFALDSLKRLNIAIAAFLGVIFAMYAESSGKRGNWDNGSMFSGSIFSREFLSRIFTSLKNLLSFVPTMNRLVFVIMVLIFCAAVGLFIYYRKKEPKCMFIRASSASLISCIVALVCIVLIAAKGGPQYARDMRSVYGVYFFGILFVSLLALYLHKKTSIMRAVFPLLTIIVVLVAANTRFPYKYTYERTYKQTTIMESYIEKAIEADRNNISVIELGIPKYNDIGNWPIPLETWSEAFSNTLYRHHITAHKMKFVLVFDESLPTP